MIICARNALKRAGTFLNKVKLPCVEVAGTYYLNWYYVSNNIWETTAILSNNYYERTIFLLQVVKIKCNLIRVWDMRCSFVYGTTKTFIKDFFTLILVEWWMYCISLICLSICPIDLCRELPVIFYHLMELVHILYVVLVWYQHVHKIFQTKIELCPFSSFLNSIFDMSLSILLCMQIVFWWNFYFFGMILDN